MHESTMHRPAATIPRRSRLDLPVESFLRPGAATAAIYPRQEEVREIIVLRNPDGTLPQSTFGEASAAQRRPAPVLSTQRTATERKPVHDPITMLSNRVATASAELKKRPVPQPPILDRFETAELPVAWQDTQPTLYAKMDHLPAPSEGMWHDASYLRKAHDQRLAWLKQRRVRARELALGIAEPTTACTTPPPPSCGLSHRTSRPTSASTTRHAPSPGVSLLPSSHASTQPSRQPSYPPSCQPSWPPSRQPSRKPSRPSSAHAYAGGAGASRVAPTRPSSAGAYVAATRPSSWPVSPWPVSACLYVGADDADTAATAASVPAFCVVPDAPEIVKHVTGLEPRPRPRRRPASASAARLREWNTERPEPLAMATPRRPPSADAGPRMPAPLMYRISYSRPPKYSFAFPPPEDISDSLLAASLAALSPATSKVDLAAHYERAPGHLGARDGAEAPDRNVPPSPPSAHPAKPWDGTAFLHSNVLVPPKYLAGGAASYPTEALDVLADALEWATPAALEVQSGSSRHLIATSRHDALPIGSGTTGGNAVVFLPLASSGFPPPTGTGGTGTSASGAAAELEALHAVTNAADGRRLDAQAVPHSPRSAQ